VQKVTRSYAQGLFHCYDDPRIPQTTNSIETLNGLEKHNLRRCSGRTSTANGPGSSYGRLYMFAIALHACLPPEELKQILSHYTLNDYKQARKLLQEVQAPATQRRAFLRNPDKYLAEILAQWLDPCT